MYKELKIEQTVQNNHINVLPKRFLWNGHTIGFGPQTEQLEPPCENPLFTLNVGERVKFFFQITFRTMTGSKSICTHPPHLSPSA